MQKGPVTPKGFRDIKPKLAEKRRETINQIADVLEKHGFEPLETPIIEFAETLLGKYGEEEKLIYEFEDRGGRKLALRYDLTVPLARYVANNSPSLPFRRYQIGQVFRGEKPQKGRYREFTQFDFDSVGTENIEEDIKVVNAAIESIKALGLENAKMAINDRANFKNLSVDDIRAIDKIHKVGKDKTEKRLLDFVAKSKPAKNIQSILDACGDDVFFDATLARGLDYYTGLIFEMKPTGLPEELSIGGGGRYDELIGMFAGKKIPAVGFSFGLDRLIEVLEP